MLNLRYAIIMIDLVIMYSGRYKSHIDFNIPLIRCSNCPVFSVVKAITGRDIFTKVYSGRSVCLRRRSQGQYV